MESLTRVPPEEAWKRVRGGAQTLLVCAYEDEERCRSHLLSGAITLKELEGPRPRIGRDRHLLFYCASPDDATAARRAAEYREKGFENVEVLDGGVDAWRQAGLPMDSSAQSSG